MERNKKLILTFLKMLEDLRLNDLQVFRVMPNKKNIMVINDFTLDNVNQILKYRGAPTVESFEDLILTYYVLNTNTIIDKALDYPEKDKVKNLPPLSITPATQEKDNKIFILNY